MVLISSLIYVVGIAASSAAAQTEDCTSPTVRKEWSSVSQSVRDNYIEAVLCLATKPSKLGLNTTFYDDFAYYHNQMNHEIHSVAQFLPWHRYFLRIYEQSLQDCGYTGTALYWDWTKDSKDPSRAAVWDAKTGMGGNGDPANMQGTMRCVPDGPFVKLKPAYIQSDYQPHCLARSFNNGTDQVGDMLGEYYSPEAVAVVNNFADYHNFSSKLEGTPHGAVHSAVGGDLTPATSPNDPIFFLHHAQIDRLWWLWQNEGQNRTYMYSGNRNQESRDGPASPPAQLDDEMPMDAAFGKTLRVREIMDTRSGSLCYVYE